MKGRVNERIKVLDPVGAIYLSLGLNLRQTREGVVARQMKYSRPEETLHNYLKPPNHQPNLPRTVNVAVHVLSGD